jgi:hypothetical protein
MALQSNANLRLLNGYHILGFLTVYFLQGGVVSPTPNPQPGGPDLHIYIPWRLGGPVIPPGIEYPFSRFLRHAWATPVL